MLGKKIAQTQRDLFKPLLIDFIDKSHKLVLLSNEIDWSYIEKDFAQYYSTTGSDGWVSITEALV